MISIGYTIKKCGERAYIIPEVKLRDNHTNKLVMLVAYTYIYRYIGGSI